MDDTASTAKLQLSRAIDGILQNAVELGVPGVSAAICNSKGIVWQGCAGFSDIVNDIPIESSRHVFGVGSITKVFAAVVVLQLLDEKRLSLTDKASSYLSPDILDGIPNASTATLAELLRHNSGVASWEDDPRWIVEGRGRDLDPDKQWSKAETLNYVRHVQSNPTTVPGRFSYSNSGFTILGLVIEKITGCAAEIEIRQRILDKIALHDTYLEAFEKDLIGRMPHRYHYATETFRRTAGVCSRFTEPRPGLIDVSASNMSVEWVTGGLVSSPKDLLTFAMALRNGQLLSDESTRLMQRWQPASADNLIGLGLFRLQTEKQIWLGHTGSTLGFTGCFGWADDVDCAISVLCNVGTMHCGSIPSDASTICLKTDFWKLALDLSSL